MGTSSSRDSNNFSTSSPRSKSGKPFTDATVELLISEQKLAPRGMMLKADAVAESIATGDTEEADLECPICFNCYNALNDVVCCKQKICTNCYVELRNAQPLAKNCHCPFCHQLGFVTAYTPAPKFHYSDDMQSERSEKKEESTSSQRRSSGSSFPNPSALAEKAAEKISTAFESFKYPMSSSTAGQRDTSSKKSIAAHHFYQEDSCDSPMRGMHTAGEQGKKRGGISSTPSPTVSVNGDVHSKSDDIRSDPNIKIKTPPSVPVASKADRASLEAQIRSQHLDFDAEREYRRQTTSNSNRRRAQSERLTGGQDLGEQRGSRRGSGGTPGSPRSEIEEITRLLAGIGSRSPRGRPTMASYEDIRRMEELMLQAALRESAEMAERTAAATSTSTSTSVDSSNASGSAPDSESENTPGTSIHQPPPAPVPGSDRSDAQIVSDETLQQDIPGAQVDVAEGMQEGMGERQDSQESDDLELELAVALSLADTRSADR